MAVQQSGVMSSGSMVEPGLWQSKATVLEMNVPGMPPEYAAKMKQSLAEHRNEASKHCITAADVKKPKEDFFGAEQILPLRPFHDGWRKDRHRDGVQAESLTQTTNMSGSYTPTTYSLDMSSAGTGPEQGMTMKMHVDAQRIGECTGKED